MSFLVLNWDMPIPEPILPGQFPWRDWLSLFIPKLLMWQAYGMTLKYLDQYSQLYQTLHPILYCSLYCCEIKSIEN